MQGVIETIRSRIGAPVRRIPPADRAYLLTRPPIWLPVNDVLREYYRRQMLLLTEGQVTWGAIVHADYHAFEPGPCDVPGIVVYAPDPAREVPLDRLIGLAREFFAIKAKEGFECGENCYTRLFDSSIPRVMARNLPLEMTGGIPVRATSLMVRRGHLPAGILIGESVPLLVHPHTAAAMIVPSRIWPREYARLWSADQVGYSVVWSVRNFVEMWPLAVSALREVMTQAGARRDWYVHLFVQEPTDGFNLPRVSICYQPTMNPKKHFLSESHGVRIIIDQTQRDLFAGLVLGLHLEVI